MNLSEIKQAINKGKNVYWVQLGYQVIESKGNYYIKCISNGSLIGLTWVDGQTLNGEEHEFFVR